MDTGLYRGETEMIVNSQGIQKEMRHGLGIMIYAKEDKEKPFHIYEGFWFRDMRHGKGLEKWQNGNEFSG